MTENPIVMTRADHRRLCDLVDSMSREDRRHFRDLCRELERARCVESEEIPADVVTMGSTARLREVGSGEEWTFTLCDPAEADADRGRISVLSPVGTAIVGCQAGDVIRWPVPAGTVRIRIEEILRQPQSEQDRDEPAVAGW